MSRLVMFGVSVAAGAGIAVLGFALRAMAAEVPPSDPPGGHKPPAATAAAKDAPATKTAATTAAQTAAQTAGKTVTTPAPKATVATKVGTTRVASTGQAVQVSPPAHPGPHATTARIAPPVVSRPPTTSAGVPAPRGPPAVTRTKPSASKSPVTTAKPSARVAGDPGGVGGIQAAPNPPGSIGAVGGVNTIVVTWAGSSGATGYTATATSGALTKTCTAAAIGCTMSNVTAGAWSVTVTATGVGGTSVASGAVAATVVDPANPPGAPTGVIASPGNRQATVSWTAPAYLGAGISSYTATASPGGASCTTSATSCTVTGLTMGGTYVFQVTATAVNGAGTSGSSLPSPLTTVGPPGPPTALVVVALPTSAQVTWVGPLLSAPVDHYLVTASPGGQTCTGVLLTCTVTGLTSGTDYTFSVVSVGPGTTGTSTATVSSAVTPGPPGPPKNVRVTPGFLTLHVEWDPPDEDGAGIGSYVATASPGLLPCGTLTAADHDCTILNLIPSTSYTVTVVAVGVGLTGTSAASPASAPVTPGPPGAPTAVTATPGNASAAVSWTAPANPGTGVTGYTVTAAPGGSGCVSAGPGCTVPLLTPGTSYTFTVVANSLAGPSPVSAASNAVTPGPPGVPTGVSATPGNGTATVSWTAPAATGAGIGGYTVAAAPGGATCTTTGTSCAVPGLTNGVAYTFAVVATGAGGTGTSLPSALSALVVPGPPDPPVLPVAAAGIGTATVSWSAPLITRAGLSGYTVTASPGGASCSTSGTTCTVTGLSAGTAYTFSVVANGPGGASSGAAAAATATPGPPGAPTGVQAVALGGALTVSWTPPLLSGNLVNIYVATALPGLHACATVNAAQHTCTITGLDDGTAYTVAVVSVGLGLTGSSAPSTPSAPVTPGPPDAATAVTAVAGATSATVSWTAPGTARAGVDTYLVTASPGGATCTTAAVSCVVSGLTSGTAYTFTVLTSGPGGSSPASTPSAAVTPGPPGVPTGVTASGGSGTATVSWTAPANQGGGIAGYTVTALPGGATCVTSGLSCPVTGLINGIGYAFRVVANGVAATGDSPPSQPTALVAPGAPDPPTAVLAVAGNGSVAVSWIPPLIQRAGVTGYTVTASPGGAGCSTSGTACTVTGLTGGTAYTFTVVATGSGGSSTGTSTTPVTPGPPGAPTGVTATAAGTTATVSWTAPANPGAGIGSYTVTASPGGASCTTVLLTCTVTGLTAGTGYSFTVVTNGLPGTGTSAASSASAGVTPGAPDAPTAVTASPGAGVAAVSWTAPVTTRAGLTNYTVTANPGGASCTTATLGCTVAGLVSGTVYTFTVTATGPGGTSPPSASSPVTRPGPPGAPTGVAVQGGSAAVTVSWTAPVNLGGGVDHYVATVTPGGASCTSSGASCTVTGLTDGVGYTASVVAVGTGSTGASLPGVTVVPVSPGPPDAPVLVLAAGGDGAAAVSWTAPLVRRAGVTGYTVTASPGGASCATAALGCTVPGLDGGTLYTFTVVASGPGGSSGPSLPSLPVLPGPPDPPAGVTAAGGNGTATVSWTAPANPGAGIVGYTVTANPGGATCGTVLLTSCTVTGLVNGVAYTFTVVAHGVPGTGDSDPGTSAVLRPGPPGAPTAVGATAGSGGAAVSWTAPAQPGSGITAYTVTASPGGASCTTATLGCTAPGLSGGTAYTFTVVASGPGGDSPASTASPQVTPGPPGAPTAVSAIGGNGTATVSWTAPANPGAGITGYTVTASPGGAVCTSAGTSCTVTGLGNGLAYTFSVVANGVTGTGTSAAGVSGLTVIGPPDAPTVVVAVAGDRSAAVSWTPPLIARAGVTDYLVTAAPGGANCTTTGVTCTVPGLSNAATYTFSVVARGPGGSSAAGGPSNPVHAGPPGAPTAVSATGGSGTATVSWTAPANPGAGILSYTVTAAPGGAQCSTIGTSCTVTGLTDGTGYTFSVVANGLLGTGTSAAGSTGAPVTSGPPDAPTAVVATAGSRSADVSWSAPGVVRAGVTTYTVTASPGGATCVTATLGCTVPGLTGGVAYTFTVVATGPGGGSGPSLPSPQVVPGPPGAPTGTGVADLGGGDALVSWTAPGNLGAGIDHYLVTAAPGGASCTTSGSSCTVGGLSGSIGYLFTVVAVGVAGTGTSLPSLPAALVPVTAPDPPTAVSAVPGIASATVSWSAPLVVRAGVTSYLVTASPGGAFCATSGTSCTVAGLVPGTAYTFDVVALGPGGSSSASDPSGSVAVGPPGLPTGVTVQGGASSATVSWTAPANLGAGIASYTVTAAPGGAQCTTTGTSCVVTGLTGGVPYLFTVVATGVTGTGGSLPSVAVGGLAGAPGAPTAVSGVAGDRLVDVSWTAPANPGAGITGYLVTGSPSGTCSASGAASTACTVTGLAPGTPFTFTVVAVGPGGTSPASAPSAADVPGPPGSPTGVTAAGGDGTATVSWTPPGNTGGGVDHYDVTAAPGAGACSSSATQCVVTGLTNGVAYTFTVTAVGADGTGTSLVGAPSAPVTPGPPDAATAVTVVPGDHAVTVSWQPPGITRAGVTSYEVAVTPGAQTCVTTATSCTITGLTAGDPYTFTVRASGPGGAAPASAATAPVVPGPPGPPTAVTVTAGPSSATVRWTAPGNAGAGIARYTVTAAPGGASCNTTSTSCTVTGLDPATAYTFSVVTVGTGATGVSSAAAAPGSLTPGPPGPPGVPTAVPGNGSAVVSWAPSGVTGPGIDHYHVVAGPGGATCDTSATSCTVTGLTRGVPYTFVVTAVGVGTSGTSAPSGASTPVVPGPPGAPTAVIATAGAGQVSVAWTPPVSAGAGISYYVVTAAPGGLNCTTGLTHCTVTGLTNGVAYTFTVVAAGVAGTGVSAPAVASASVSPGPPGAPAAVVATAGSGTATVTWLAPALAGAGIDHYTVTADPGGMTCTARNATSCTVTGLTGGVSYTFTVTANGVSGDSPASTPSVAILPGPPGTPGGLTAEPGNGAATVSWTPPANQGAGIDHYTVTASPGGAGCTSIATSCTVTGLVNGASYTFAVVATGPAGTGTSATVTTAAPVVVGPPAAPGGVSAAVGDRSAVVSWQPPATGVVTGYTVTAAPGGGTCTTTGATTCTVSGLTNGLSYTFTVTAAGPGGTSQASAASPAVVPGPPAAPTAVLAVAGNGEANVSWTGPAAGGVTRFTVTASPGGATCTGAGTDTNCLVTGLINGVSYTFTVTATGPGGDSGPSLPSAVATPTAGLPGAPTDVTAAPGTASATVSWSAPQVTGDGITGYTVTASPGGAGCATTGTSCTVNGLLDGTPYTFSVVATGSAGASAPGVTSAPVVPGPPAAPAGVTVTPGNGQLAVAWVPGSGPSGGSRVTGYTATASPGGLTCTGTGTRCTITGLGNGVTYTVTVVADGPGGTSGATAAAPAVPGPAGVPGNATATPAPNAATVSWTTPATAGAGITHYVVTATPGGQTCTTSGPSCVVGGLAPGTPVSFAVVAYGNGGASLPAATAPVVPGPPAAPDGVAATPGNGTASVGWDPPTGGGAGVDVYTVTAAPGGAGCTTAAYGCTVTGLTNGVTYTFTVVAHGVGAAGSSAPSQASAPVTPAGTRPGPAVAVTVTAGNGSADVSWTPPAVTGDGVDHYEVVTDDGQSCVTTTISCTVTGLTNGRAYRFRVRVVAVDDPGVPISGDLTAPVTPSAGQPLAPTAVSAVPGDAAATISWTAPSGGPPVTGYTVTAVPGGLTCTATGTTCVITGLVNGQAYEFTAVAHGPSGTSAGSAPSNPVVPTAPYGQSGLVPHAPVTVTAVSADGRATVTWTPAATGATPTGYTVTAAPGGLTCTTTGTTCVITGLTNGRAYTFTVVAHSPDGNSPPSPPSAPVYPGVAPDVPTAVVAVARNSGLYVRWRLPAATGSGIDHFTATSNASNGRCVTTTATASQCMMFVPIGADYQVSVVANGVYGHDSPPVRAVTRTRPTFPDMPPTAPDSTGAGPLDSTYGAATVRLTHGEPITLTGRGFAPNSSVRFALYATPASGRADAGASGSGVRIDLLGTPTVGPDGTVRLQTTVPAAHDAVEAFAYLARGVGPDDTVRSLVLWANVPSTPANPTDPVTPPDPTAPTPTSPDLTTPVTPVTSPATVPVRGPAPSRRAGSAGGAGGLATTGVPVAPIVLSGLLLLVAGALVRRAGSSRRP
ncbi:beta strand repeat-containing protein [Dactylosporangium siamense]|uniref:beta strand repeat-containing protein n=1 Tax=Dactylosporangium siamense TaxID=685454 RepID=UPI0019430FC0|nr:fibronectin type III domain-containing protein [Dactylosporangium siamense]